MEGKYFIGWLTLLVFLTSHAVANKNRIVSQTLKTEDIFQNTDHMWGLPDMCPENHFISGLRLHPQPYQGKANTFGKVLWGIGTYGVYSTYDNLARNNDDQGLLGIDLYCWPFHMNPNIKFPEVVAIKSKVGSAHQSVWSEALYCDKGFAIGFQLRVQQRQYAADDYGAINFKVLCSSGKELTTTLPHEVGDWPREGYKMCKKNSAICGLKTKVEDADVSDRVGVEAVEIYCCNLPAKTEVQLAKDGTPRREWELIASQDNTDGVRDLQQTYTKKTGISDFTSSRTLNRESNSEANAQTWGINSEASVNIKVIASLALKQNFQTSFNNSQSRDYEAEKLLTNSMKSEVEHKVSYVVPPGYISKIYQYVGHCGPYTIHSKAIKKVDEPSPGMKNANFGKEKSI